MTELKLTAGTESERRVLDYLQENASQVLAEKINNGEKTLSGCFGYIRSEARKQAQNGVAVIEDATVYGWAVHYFEEDSIKEGSAAAPQQTPEQEKKRMAERLEAEKRRKAEEAEKMAKKIAEAEERRKAQREKAQQRAQEAAERARAKAEKENKAAAGQFSLFDLFGTEG